MVCHWKEGGRVSKQIDILQSFAVSSKVRQERSDVIVVYALICPLDNEPFYVGKTNNPEQRLRDHSLNHPHYQRLAVHDTEYQFKLVVLARYPLAEYQPYYETEWILELLERGFHLQNAVFPTKLYPPYLQRYFKICQQHNWLPQKNEYERWTMPNYGGVK